MAIDLRALSSAATTATALSGLILVTPQDIGIIPQNPNSDDGQIRRGPKSFFFDYKGEETIDLMSEITDHFVEDNTAIADQIALKPEKIKTQGFIAELNDIAPEALEPLKFAAEKLTIISGYVPQLSATALRAYNIAFQGYQTAIVVANSAVQAWDETARNDERVNVITGTETDEELAKLRSRTKNQTKQQIAFQQFYGYWRNKTLFTVQTPWAIFRNMAIETLRVVQEAETESLSSFELSLKIMRFAETETRIDLFNNKNGSNRFFNQGESLIALGTSTPVPDISLATAIG